MVFAKGIMNIQASVALDVDGNNVLNFAFEVKDNFDDQTGAFDSYNLYSYFIPVSEITLQLVQNLDAAQADYFEMSWSKNQLAFPVGEYYNIDGNAPLNVADIYAGISAIIYA
jgi:hypothetical protein